MRISRVLLVIRVICIVFIMSRQQAPPPEPKDLEIFIDRANKTYEPGEKVVGYVNLATPFESTSGFEIKAEAYMDTVSVIRGNAGRGPLPENERIYFMKKVLEFNNIAVPKAPVAAEILAPKAGKSFEFILEATESGEKLVDTYVGVDFSVIYKITCSYKLKGLK